MRIWIVVVTILTVRLGLSVHVLDDSSPLINGRSIPRDRVRFVSEHIIGHHGLKQIFSDTHSHTDFFSDSFVTLSESINVSDEWSLVA